MSTGVAAEDRLISSGLAGRTVESCRADLGSTLILAGTGAVEQEHAGWLASLLGQPVAVVDVTEAGAGSAICESLRVGRWSTVVFFAGAGLDVSDLVADHDDLWGGLSVLDEVLSASTAGGVDRFVTATSPAAAVATAPGGAALNIAERRTAAAALETGRCYLSARIQTVGGHELLTHALLAGGPGEVLAVSDIESKMIPPGGEDEIFTPTADDHVWRALVAPVRSTDLSSPGSSHEQLLRLAGATPPAESMEVLLSPPVVGEEERTLLIDALDSGWIAPAGPHLDLFEEELRAWVDGREVVALSSGSAALHLALLVLGVVPGDDVVVQTATFAATAFAVRQAGANPIFCDVDATTGNLDPDLLAELLDERARSGRLPAAVVPVDLYGLCADYDRLRAVCAPYGVPIIQDSAESLGSRAQGRAAGAQGDLGVLSFNGNKIITTSGGGALVGPSDLVARARKLSTQAREPALHYQHAEIGFNYRMSNLLAAVGLAQLRTLEERVTHRADLDQRYRCAFPELTWMPPGVTERWNHWLTVAFLPPTLPPHFACRELASAGIEARPFWKPMHRQPVFAGAEARLNGRSDAFFAHGLCLPSGHGLDEESQDRVIDRLRSLLDRYANASAPAIDSQPQRRLNPAA